jgi:hypothetical protein
MLLLDVLFLVVAVSRWFALSTSQLDWDEALFAAGVRSYDVTIQHPHPPGYPLFILFAKIARLVVHDNFRSLQAVVTVASLLLFPATFFLLRELRSSFRLAISGAVITAFLPTVWYYGGTALSDIPALCAVVVASALLLAGGRNPRFWIAGMFVAGIAGGIRPMHVVIAAVPAVVGALALRRPRVIVTGCAVFAAVVAASYTGAALATANPPWGYLRQLGVTVHYIHSTDSFDNVARPPLRQLVSTFFVYVHGGGMAGLALLALTAVAAIEAAVRRRAAVGIILAMFVPTAIASWMMLDKSAATRYGLAYVMLYGLGGAYGIDVLARAWKSETVQTTLTAAATILLAVAMIDWARPALALVRHQASPPIAAMRWIREHGSPTGRRVYFDANLGYHTEYELAGYDIRGFDTYDQIPPDAYVAGNYCLVDRLTIQPHGVYFSFPRLRLAEIARSSYFETSVIPMDRMIRFGEGWYQDEYDHQRTRAWRWMRQSSVTLFPPIKGEGELRLSFHLPLDALPRPSKLTIIWNGTVIEQSVCKDLESERRYVLASRSSAPNECRILVDQAAHAPGDPRDLGLGLVGVSWEASPLQLDRAAASDGGRAVSEAQAASRHGRGAGVAEVLRNDVDERHTDRAVSAWRGHGSAIDTGLEDAPPRPDRLRPVRAGRDGVRR